MESPATQKTEESSFQAARTGTVHGMERRPGCSEHYGHGGAWRERRREGRPGQIRLESFGKGVRLFPRSSGKPLNIK